MTNPIHIIGLASSAMNGIAKSVTEVINTKEHQRTVRWQNQAECLQQIVAAYHQYQTVVAEEQTKRGAIETWEKTTLKEIEKQRDILLKFLERSFDERAKNFQYLFEVLDQAIASGNNEHLSLVLNKITELAKSSPFKDIRSYALTNYTKYVLPQIDKAIAIYLQPI